MQYLHNMLYTVYIIHKRYSSVEYNSASCYITLLAILHKNLMVSYSCLLEDGAVDNATKGHQFVKGHSLRNHGCLYRSG